MKSSVNQQIADYYKRNVYVYLLKDGSKIASYFEYKQGDFYGGRQSQEIDKLVKTFIPVKK